MILFGVPLWGWLLLGGSVAFVTALNARSGRIRGPLSLGLYVVSVLVFIVPIVLVSPRIGFAGLAALVLAALAVSAALDRLAERVKKTRGAGGS